MQNKSGEIGDPWGTPTITGEAVSGEPENSSVQKWSDKKDIVH